MVTYDLLNSKEDAIGVIGLGYVGLPLACALAKKFRVIGFDIKKERIQELKAGIDSTNEVSSDVLKNKEIIFSSSPEDISTCRFLIIAVPTPVDENNTPNLDFVFKATETVGTHLAKGSIIVYESTVYPGVTEDLCVPILEQTSGLKMGIDFKVGYSPERINPGDKEHTIDKVTKIVSGSDDVSIEIISGVYGSITKIFRASSIKVAEAAKVIENTQRDLNVALMNELAIIFSKMGINTHDVIAAASTKWNFLKFYPGLVGGHCIGVDPYYLTYKAQQLGYQPEVISAGRRINNSMGGWIVGQLMKKIFNQYKGIKPFRVLVAGLTFKEDIRDLRNSKVVDIINELKEYGLTPLVYDPNADKFEAQKLYNIKLCEWSEIKEINLVIVAVAHKEFVNMDFSEWKKIMSGDQSVFADLKNIFNKDKVEKENLIYWSL